jgi:peroxiredoxin
MRRLAILRFFLLASLLPIAGSVAAEPTSALPFHLEGVDGNRIEIEQADGERLQVLCFLGTECPLARNYGPKLERLSKSYQGKKIQFIGVMSNVQDSVDEVASYTKEHGIHFPVGKDHDQKLANHFGATRTPEVFVLDPKGIIRYRGRIDNQYRPGVTKSEATEHNLRDAIDALLVGQEPAVPSTVATGCLIGRNQQAVTDFSVTYCNQIVRILNRNCVECHRKNEIGPFRLDEYEEVIGWGDMCLEVVQEGRMPPWHATTDHQVFSNARIMSDQDKQLLEHWVHAGMPFGDGADLPPTENWVDGWRLRTKPDAIFPMSSTSFEIPAEGTVEYQYFVVDPKFEEDKWVTAAEVLPGNAAVVHHCIVFIRPPDGSALRQAGLLSAYVPGQIRSPLPEGFAQKIPAGSRLVFQMHYTPNGKPAQDCTRLGLVFTEERKVTHEVLAIGGAEQEFEIPPKAPNHVVDGKIQWHPNDGYLISIMPHMHLRGKSFTLSAEKDTKRQAKIPQNGIQENNTAQTLLEVPAYDFNWQHNYELLEPLALEDIQSLRFTATFDNSSDNPFNPDPDRTVTWGDQTWQEMAVVFLNVARPRYPINSLPDGSNQIAADTSSNTKSKQQITDNQMDQTGKDQAGKDQDPAKQFAAQYLARFDQNQDGYLDPHELPNATKIFLFRQMDHNRDGRIEIKEIEEEAQRRDQIPDAFLSDT